MTPASFVLGLHIAGPVIGAAYGAYNGSPVSYLWRLDARPDDHGAMGAAFLDVMSDHYKVVKPIRIGLTAGLGGNSDDIALRLGFIFAAKIFAFRRGLPLHILAAPTLHSKRGITGPSLDRKVEDWCRAKDFSPGSFAAAHALVAWDEVTALEQSTT